jgi:hypothetical protein
MIWLKLRPGSKRRIISIDTKEIYVNVPTEVSAGITVEMLEQEFSNFVLSRPKFHG